MQAAGPEVDGHHFGRTHQSLSSAGRSHWLPQRIFQFYSLFLKGYQMQHPVFINYFQTLNKLFGTLATLIQGDKQPHEVQRLPLMNVTRSNEIYTRVTG